MSKAKKWICLAVVLLSCLFMAIGLFGISLQSVSAAVDSAEAENAVIVERQSPDKISGSNYAGYSIQVAFADAPQLTGEEAFWGVRVQNLRAETARVRYGFEMGGGVCLWLGPADTVNYFVSDDGTITPFTVTSAQYIDIPANFSGYVYTPKAACYGWTTESEAALVKNNYRAKGVRWAYDYRATGAVKVALYGLSVANFTETEGVVAISDFSFASNFDAATASNIYLGGDETAQAAMAADLDCRIVPAAVFDSPVSMEITQMPTLTEYSVGMTADFAGGVATVTYSAEDVSEAISYPLTSSVFSVSGFDASVPTETLPITVTLTGTQITATFNVKVGMPDLPDADEEEGQYIVVDRTNSSVNVAKTGWLYVQFAMSEFIENDTNAIGRGNCIGVRIENIEEQFNLRLELRSKNTGDAENAATHRTGMWNNINAYAWFVEDDSREVTSVGFSKTSQTLQIPEGAAGTLYLNYETDFSWKGHTADYGISHVAFGINLTENANPCFIVKEIFDAQFTIKDDAEFIDIDDIYDNAAAESTHFTTDVVINNLERFLSTKECDITDVVPLGLAQNTIPNCRHDIMILGNTNYATWTGYTEEIFQEELDKVRVAAYTPDDFTVQSISVKAQPKAQYTVGDLADWSEGIVTVTYVSGRTQDYAMTDSIFEVSGFSSIAVKDSLTITVTFAEDADIFTTFTVSVAASGSSGGNKEDTDDTQSGGCSSSVAGFSVVTLAAGAIVVAVSLFIRKKRI